MLEQDRHQAGWSVGRAAWELNVRIREYSERAETVYEAFIRCRVMAAAARSADIVEIQAQQLQGDPDAYRSFVVEATAQARGADPSVRVIAGLTTAGATSAQMLMAWRSVGGVLDGYYRSIHENRDVRIALDFLRGTDSAAQT